MTTFELEVLTPQKCLYKGQAEMVIAPGEEGDFGVLARHAPMVIRLCKGMIRIHQQGVVTEEIAIQQGWANISEQNCLLLVRE